MARKKARKGKGGYSNGNGYEEDYESFEASNDVIPNGFTITFDEFDKIRDDGPDYDNEAPRGGYGSQVLPVALEVPEDFEGEPENGDEYLFLVRREAASHPGIIIADAFVAANLGLASTQVYQAIEVEAGPSHRPSVEWRTSFLARFSNMRQTFATATAPSIDDFSIPNHYLPIPSAADESSWNSYIHGRRQKVPNPNPSSSKGKEKALDIDIDDYEAISQTEAQSTETLTTVLKSEPKPPIPLILHRLEQHTVISLLDHFNTWLQDRIEAQEQEQSRVPSTIFLPTAMRKKNKTRMGSSAGSQIPALNKAVQPPSVNIILDPLDSQWILSLLTVLETLLTSKQISILRTLARTCKEVADVTARQTQLPGVTVEQKKSLDDSIAGCWMTISVVWEVWFQRDLWDS